MVELLPEDVVLFNRDLCGMGIRDIGLLKSALGSAFQSAFGEELYPDILDKASRICFGIVKNHPFVDGNKRTAVHCLFVFLFINGIVLEVSDDKMVEVLNSIADGSMGFSEFSSWLKSQSLSGL